MATNLLLAFIAVLIVVNLAILVRLITRKEPMTNEKNNFFSPCFSTADGRWFDNFGFPIEAPTKLEPEKQLDPEEPELEKQRK